MERKWYYQLMGTTVGVQSCNKVQPYSCCNVEFKSQRWDAAKRSSSG
jgi:hypothetical protein